MRTHTHTRAHAFPLSSRFRTHSSVHSSTSSFMSSLLFFFIRVFQIRGLEGLWWLEFRRSRVQVPSDFFSKIGAPFLGCYKWFQSMQQQATRRWYNGTIEAYGSRGPGFHCQHINFLLLSFVIIQHGHQAFLFDCLYLPTQELSSSRTLCSSCAIGLSLFCCNHCPLSLTSCFSKKVWTCRISAKLRFAGAVWSKWVKFGLINKLLMSGITFGDDITRTLS